MAEEEEEEQEEDENKRIRPRERALGQKILLSTTIKQTLYLFLFLKDSCCLQRFYYQTTHKLFIFSTLMISYQSSIQCFISGCVPLISAASLLTA